MKESRQHRRIVQRMRILKEGKDSFYGKEVSENRTHVISGTWDDVFDFSENALRARKNDEEV